MNSLRLALLGAFALGACTFNPSVTASLTGAGGAGGSGVAAIPGLTALRVEPQAVTVVMDPAKPKPQQKYEAIGVVNGRQVKLTDRVIWSSDRLNVASVDATGLATVGNSGGIARISASNGMISGSASLTVHASGTFMADGANANPPLPADPASKFRGGSDSARNPQLVYPNDHVLFPPNVFGIEIHWRPGSAANTLYELRFKSDIGDFKVYTRCQPLADGCLYQPSKDVWTAIAETNRGGGNVQMILRATDDAGSAVGTSATFTLAFSKDALRGGLYYWTTSGGTGIMRWNFGDTTKTMAEKFIGTQFTGDTCVGCHALSRDGKKIVASAGGQDDGRLLLFDVARAMPMAGFPLAQKSQFESWNPDGSQFVGVYTDDRKRGPSNLMLFDGNTGAKTGEIDLGGLRADHPDWSRDGARIVFTSVDTTGSYTDQRPGRAGLAYIDRTSGGWSPPQALLPAQDGKNRFYPAIAPDNQVLVYDESACKTGTYAKECNADTDPTATLWVTRLPPAATSPVKLGLANAPGVADNGATDLTNSFPKWAPFVFQLSEERKLLWLTVSSSRQYGLRAPPTGAHEEADKGTLIWMIGIDPNNLLTNQDPSYAAFALPFQDISTSNHIAQWTEEIPPPIK